MDELWCELVLNGIGGTTIAEAKERISYPEWLQWCAYRAKRGSLNVGQRVEYSVAMMAMLYANAHKGRDVQPFKLHEFAPNHDQPELTLDQLANWT